MGTLKDFVEGISTNSYADAKDVISSIIDEKYRGKVNAAKAKMGLKKHDDEYEDEEEMHDEKPRKAKKSRKHDDVEDVEGAAVEEGAGYEGAYDSAKSRSYEQSSGNNEFKVCSNYQPLSGFKAGNSPDNNKKTFDSLEKSGGSKQVSVCKNYMPLPFKEKGMSAGTHKHWISDTSQAGGHWVTESVEDNKVASCKKCKNRKVKKMNDDGEYEA
jgi:hypothetical protein